MKQCDWTIGLITGMVGGMILSTLNKGPSIFRMKVERKKEHFQARGKAEYEAIQTVKEDLQATAKQNV